MPHGTPIVLLTFRLVNPAHRVCLQLSSHLSLLCAFTHNTSQRDASSLEMTAFVQSTVTTESQFQRELNDAKEGDYILLVEVFSRWCGPCPVLKPALQYLLSERKFSCAVNAVSVDIDRVVKGLRTHTDEIDWSQGEDDTAPARWSRILLPWIGTIEPTFLLFRRGKLCSITEGLNIPQIEFHLDWMSQPDLDVENIRIGITQKEINSAAFVIQAKWRRKKQLERMGIYINGIFRTHSEVFRDRERQRAESEQRARERGRHVAAILIQKMIRGYLARRWFAANKKQLLQRFRLMRKGNPKKPRTKTA